MLEFLPLLQNAYSEFLTQLAKGFVFGMATVIAIGGLYCVHVRRQNRQPIGVRAILSDIFPKENYTHRTSRFDRISFGVNMFLSIPLSNTAFSIVGLIIGVSFADFLGQSLGTPVPWLEATWAVVAVQFLGTYLGLHFVEWWMHYAMHKVPALWAIHRTHHSAERANFFTVGRGHPLEELLLGAARVTGATVGGGLALYVTGNQLLPETVAFQTYIGVVLGALGTFGHLHIPIQYGSVLTVIFTAPVLHQIHHSAELRHRDKNMGTAIFDLMFGTLYLPRPGETFRWGLNEEQLEENNPHNSLKDFYLDPFREWGAMLRRARASRSDAKAIASNERVI